MQMIPNVEVIDMNNLDPDIMKLVESLLEKIKQLERENFQLHQIRKYYQDKFKTIAQIMNH